MSLQTSVKYNKIFIDIIGHTIIVNLTSSSLKNKDIMLFLKNGQGEVLCKKTYVAKSIIHYHTSLQNNQTYSLNLLVRKGNENVYWSYFQNNDILLCTHNGELSIKCPPIILGNNSKFSNLINQPLFVKNSLECNDYIQAADARIKALAYRISKGIFFDYAKLLAVHNWVAENIYYDLDALHSGQYKYNDASALGTLTARKGVCQGISNLSIAILRSMGIPAYGVQCFALGVSTSGGWEIKNNLNATANHQITIAYADKRWVIMDITWDSDNIFENGEYKQKTGLGVSHKYFDSTIMFISNTHRFM